MFSIFVAATLSFTGTMPMPSIHRPTALFINLATGDLFSSAILRHYARYSDRILIVRVYDLHMKIRAKYERVEYEYTENQKPTDLKSLEDTLHFLYTQRRESFVHPLAIMADLRCTAYPDPDDLQGSILRYMGTTDFPFQRVIAEYPAKFVPAFMDVCVDLVRSYPNGNAFGSVIWSFRTREDMLVAANDYLAKHYRQANPTDVEQLTAIRRLAIELKAANWHRVRNPEIVKNCEFLLETIPLNTTSNKQKALTGKP